MKIKNIKLIFNYVDKSFRNIDPHEIDLLNIDEVTEMIHLANNDSEYVSWSYKFEKTYRCKYFNMILHIDEDIETLKELDDGYPYENVTAIEIEYQDGSKQYIEIQWVKWNGDDCDNKIEVTRYKNGDIEILYTCYNLEG